MFDPDHFHSCLKDKAFTTQRHEAIVQVVIKLARSVGFHATHEPRFPSTLVPTIDPTTNQETTKLDQNLKHGDILLIHGNKQILIDVSVTRPTGLTHLHTKDMNRVPKLSAKLTEVRKHRLYDAECAKHGWKLIPFVFESYGGLGREGEKFLLDLAEMSQEESPTEFLADAQNMLSVALQSGNANISVKGQERLNESKYHSNPLQVIWQVNQYDYVCDTAQPGITQTENIRQVEFKGKANAA